MTNENLPTTPTPTGADMQESSLTASLIPTMSALAVPAALGITVTGGKVANTWLTQRGKTQRAEIRANERIEIARIQQGAPPAPPSGSADS